jgi:hypothetical protein
MNFINHENSRIGKTKKPKAQGFKLVKGVKQMVGIPSACVKNLQITIKQENTFFGAM